jgi:hypothetical protein
MFQPDLDNGRVKPILPASTLPSLDLGAAFPTGRRASGTVYGVEVASCSAMIDRS